MILHLLLLLFSRFIVCASYLDEFVFPSEFQCPHESVWIAWSVDSAREYKTGYPIKSVHLDIIEALTPYVKVRIAYNDDSEKDDIISELKKRGIDEKKVILSKVLHPDIWIRDFGPNYLVNKKFAEKKLAWLKFTQWGYDLNMEQKETIQGNNFTYVVSVQSKLEIIKADPFLSSEGGDRIYNGNGVLMTVEQVEKQRNPNYSLKEMEEIYKKVMGVEKVIWLKKGVIEDDMSNKRIFDGENKLYTFFTTNGHADEFCRFVSEDTILIASISEEEYKNTTNLLIKENYKRMKENIKILEKETDLNGKKYNIIQFPSPVLKYETLNPGDSVYEGLSKMKFVDGTVFPYGKPIKGVVPSSYMNFLLSHEVILLPQFYVEGEDPEVLARDKQAKEIMEKLFPDRKVIGINPYNVNVGGGGINCITQQVPVDDCFVGKKKL